jgi:hypothetical protein
MVRIAISVEAFEAIAKTLPLAASATRPRSPLKGERLIWLAGAALGRKLAAMRESGESYSDVIIRLTATDKS